MDHSSATEEDNSGQLQGKERERRKEVGSKIHQVKREIYK